MSSIPGPSHEQGGTLWELEGGERVLSVGHNRRIGGAALSNEELVKLVELGRATIDNRSSLPSVVGGANESADREAELRVNIPLEAMAAAYKEASMLAAEKTIAYWKERPVEWIEADGTKVMQRYRGRSIEQIRIKNG